jgi:hypothetical protein
LGGGVDLHWGNIEKAIEMAIFIVVNLQKAIEMAIFIVVNLKKAIENCHFYSC